MRISKNPKGGRVLIIDDTRYNFDVLSEILAPDNYEIIYAADGETGLELALKEKPDLVLLDLVLPGIMGIEVLEILKRDQPETIVVLTTAYGSEETAIQAMRLGVNDYIINKRPFDKVEVREVVRRAIAEARLRRENRRLGQELENANAQLKEYAGNLERTVEEVRDANERLKELDHIKASFFSMISHELRHPLTVAKGYLELLETGQAGQINQDAKHYIHIVNDNLDQLAGMFDDLLDLSRMEAGRFPIELQSVQPSAFVNHAVQGFSASARDKGLTLENKLPPDLPRVNADPLRMVQVLSNLIQNAIKFTQDGGTIQVSAQVLNGEIEFCVSDNGIGIPRKDREKIFDRFYQVMREGTNFRGAGLGLAICREIVKLHGGKIWVESEEGSHSKFYFTLPVAVEN